MHSKEEEEEEEEEVGATREEVTVKTEEVGVALEGGARDLEVGMAAREEMAAESVRQQPG